MAKYFRVQDRLILGFALLADSFFELTKSVYIRHDQAIGLLPPDYKITNYYGAVSRLLKTGYIEKIIKNGEPYFRLTGEGKRKLVRDLPILRLRSRKWDGWWRMVFYDIPEKDKRTRKAVQYKLLELGFGALQKSVYLSPYDLEEDLREFIESQGLEEVIFVTVAKRLSAGNDKKLAIKAWRLDRLNKHYAEFLDDLDDFVNGRGKLTFEQLYCEFEMLMRQDPFLPKELLPDWWLGDEAFKKMKLILKQKAGQKKI